MSKEINKSGKTKLSNHAAGVADAIHVYYKRLSKLDCHIEVHRLRVFVNGLLRRISGHVRDEVTGVGGDCIIRSFMLCTACQMFFG